ncbi:MAG: ABC transporter substrate-binding protein [Spirochaetales bacterium]|nr:ABC transporter substrate-binding protein [Spirochaetales bacterium]
MKRRILLLALTAMILAGAAAFAGGEKEGAAAPAGEPIKVGAILAVTGPASFLGAPEAKTLEMLVEQANAQGGIGGRPVELIIKDSQGSPEKAISFAKQLIEEEQVLAILGPSTSGESMNIKGVCEEGRTILLSCAAAETIVDPVASYVFKTPQKDSYAAIWIYKTMQEMGIDKVAVLASNTGFGQGGKAQLEKYAPEHGIEIAITEVYDKEATDLTGVLTKVKARGVQAVVNWSIEPAQSIIAKNMRQIGMTIPLFQSHGFGNIRYVEAAGEAAEGIIFPCGRLLVADVLPADHPQKQLLTKYKSDYESRYGEDVSTFGGHAYDAYLLLEAAVRKAGSVEPEKVRAAMENLQGLVGTAGIFNLSPADHNGLGLDSFEMLTVKDGRFVLFE